MSTQPTSEEAPFIWHTPQPTQPNPTVCVVFAVPAKDEEDSIADCIAAFEGQRGEGGNPWPQSGYEVLILVNNTTDATVRCALAARRNPGIHVVSTALPPELAHIGWARRLAMNWGSQRLAQNGQPEGVIVSTDADSRLSPDFVHELSQTFASPTVDAAGASLALQGELPGGVFGHLNRYFSLEKALRSKAQKQARIDLMHSHFTGAGFAVRQRVYEAVGGLTPFPYNEDKQFYYKLLQRDARIRMNDRLVVHTSARMTGRTEWGMAAQFRQWQQLQESGERVFVSSAQSQWVYFQLQMALYNYWLLRTEEKRAQVCQYLQACCLPNALGFLAKIEVPPYFGQYWCCVWEHPKLVEARQSAFPAVDVHDSFTGFGEFLAEPSQDASLQRA